jgi:hypothetical protein
MKPEKNHEKPTTSDEKEIHLNVGAKKCLFESFMIDIFNQMSIPTKAKNYLNLYESHDDTSNVCK